MGEARNTPLPSKAFRIRATYFDRRIRDVIFFFTNPSTFASQYINQNKEHDHGVELETDWKPSSPAFDLERQLYLCHRKGDR